jgi:hypothetical protein
MESVILVVEEMGLVPMSISWTGEPSKPPDDRSDDRPEDPEMVLPNLEPPPASRSEEFVEMVDVSHENLPRRPGAKVQIRSSSHLEVKGCVTIGPSRCTFQSI